MSNVTFVTSYNIIYENDSIASDRGIKWRIEQFNYLSNLGINICVYGDNITKSHIIENIKDKPNIKFMDFDYKNCFIYNTSFSNNFGITDNRNLNKDTKEYMTLMNSKIEFINDTIINNPFNTEYFAWIDFSINYVFKDSENTLSYIKYISDQKFIKKFIAFPGWWNKIPNYNIEQFILNNVCWRFCGGFFIGDKDSMIEFYNNYKKYFLIFLNTYNKHVWEVNFWAYMESYCDIFFNWYKVNNNDEIIKLPEYFFEK